MPTLCEPQEFVKKTRLHHFGSVVCAIESVNENKYRFGNTNERPSIIRLSSRVGHMSTATQVIYRQARAPFQRDYCPVVIMLVLSRSNGNRRIER